MERLTPEMLVMSIRDSAGLIRATAELFSV
jgi:hypothetical protein